MSDSNNMSAEQLNTNGGSNAAAPPQHQQPTDAATVLQQQTLNLDARLQQVEAALAQAQRDLASSNDALLARQAATPTSSATPAVEKLKIPEPERYHGSQDRVSVREW